MKKIFTTMLLALVCGMALQAQEAPLFATSSLYDYDFVVNGLCYVINNDSTSVTVTSQYYSDGASPVYANLSGDLVIPETVTYNGKSYSVTKIDNHAFYLCYNLTSVTIPNSVTFIGPDAFCGCSSVESIIVQSDNSNYDSRNNCNAIIETASNTLLFGCKNSVIPNSITTIGECAFEGCSGLTSLNIPNSVVTIGEFAFLDCSGLTSLTIPNSVVTIGRHAFESCSGLISVVLGENLKTIENEAFYDDGNILSVTCKSYSPASVEYNSENIFMSCVYTNATLYVPSGSLSLYNTAPVWMIFDNIIEVEAVQPTYGDLNGDGQVDISDVNMAINLMLGKVEQTVAGDVTGDGKVDISDVNAVINAMLGK